MILFRCVYQKAPSLEGFALPCAVRPCASKCWVVKLGGRIRHKEPGNLDPDKSVAADHETHHTEEGLSFCPRDHFCRPARTDGVEMKHQSCLGDEFSRLGCSQSSAGMCDEVNFWSVYTPEKGTCSVILCQQSFHVLFLPGTRRGIVETCRQSTECLYVTPAIRLLHRLYESRFTFRASMSCQECTLEKREYVHVLC